MGAKSIVEASALQSIAVGDFDRVHAGGIERRSDLTRLLGAVLVANGMAAIAQGYVGNIEFLAGIECHGVCPQPWMIACAMRSAVASAAEVMMSRLPA